jgi:hypothetical protein
MKRWRWIGIIASVIWFFGFGVLLWNQYVEDAVAPYGQDLKICSAIEEYSDQFWHENARDEEELSEKLQANQDEYEKCTSKAKLRWESERPSDSVAIVAVLVIDLVTIALGWLIVWGCVALGRWVHRWFAAN